jgi:tetratricopeptide (TPR) repeat protein
MRDRAGGRFRLLEPVRLYAGEKLAELGLVRETAERHARYYAAYVVSATLSGQAHEVAWLDRLEADHDNIRAALRWALDEGEDHLALELAGGAWEFWRLRGHQTEGRQWLDRAIAAAPGLGDEQLAAALLGAGALAGSQGDDGAAEEYLQRALEVYGHDDVAAASVTRRLATLPHRRGDLRRAASLFEEALRLAMAGKDQAQIGHIGASLGLVYEDLGRAAEAKEMATAAMAAAEASGDPYVLADALLTRTELAINHGDLALAESALSAAADLARREGFGDVIAWAHLYAGRIASAASNLGEAVTELERGLAHFQAQGQPDGEVWALRHLARIAITAGDTSRAESLFRSALVLASEHVLPEAPIAVQGLGEVAVAKGDLETGLMLLAAAESAAAEMGLVRHSSDLDGAAAAEDAVGRVFDADLMSALKARGRALSIDAVRKLLG